MKSETPESTGSGVFILSHLTFGLGAGGGVGRGGLMPRPGPDGFPVLLGAFSDTVRFPLLMLIKFGLEYIPASRRTYVRPFILSLKSELRAAHSSEQACQHLFSQSFQQL